MSVQNDSKMQVAEYVVDGMPGMYTSAAALTRDPDAKQLLIQASEMFQAIIDNPDTRAALAESLATSPRIDEIIAEMDNLKKNPEALNQLKTQLSSG